MSKPCDNQLSCTLKKQTYTSLFSSSMHTEHYEFRQCDHCQLIYHLPGTNKFDLERHYTEYGIYSNRAYFEKELQSRKIGYTQLAYKLKNYLANNTPTMLEVGCANGILLKYFSDCGYECYGIEIDPASAQLAMSLIGETQIEIGCLSSSPFLNQSFDLVICNQTIEHTPNPFELLCQINTALKPGGILYISTPNFGGISFKVLKDRWKNTLPTDHISMFTPKTLTHYLNYSGFSEIETQINAFDYNFRRDHNKKYRKFEHPVFLFIFRAIGFVLRYLNYGDRITTICQKS